MARRAHLALSLPLGAALLVPLGSALGSAAIPQLLRLLLAVLWLVAIIRPHLALVALTVLVPFGTILLAALDVAPVRYTEALVVATLSGTLIASGRARLTPLRSQPPALGPPALLFCAVVASSAAVVLAVSQAGVRTEWALREFFVSGQWLFLRSFAIFLARDYLVGPPGEFVGMADAALLLQGVGLLWLVARHARDGVMRPVHLMRALASAGVVAALLSLGQLFIQAAGAGSAREMFARVADSRTSVHIADVNAAGSYFAMAGFVALALAFWGRTVAGFHPPGGPPKELVQKSPSVVSGFSRTTAGPPKGGRHVPFTTRRHEISCRLWVAAALILFAAVWLTGSRMAIVAATGTLVIGAMTAGPWRPRRWPSWSVVTVAIAAALAVGAIALGLDPRPAAAGRGVLQMMSSRGAFMITGLRMVKSAPTFGVGIGRYLEMSGRFMPQSIYWFYFHENAHNNFLQIAGELGLVGLGSFVWLLVVATRRLAGGLKAYPRDRLLAGAGAALAAFVTTWMTSHPMLVAEVAYPFWILLAVAIARADGDVQPPLAFSPPVARLPRTPASFAVHVMAAAGVAILVASVPLRARREVATLDLAKQSFGFYEWEQEDGRRFRWTSRRATFFIPGSARELHVPLRAIHLGGNRMPTTVSIAIGGRTLHEVELPQDDWTTVRILLPREAERDRYHRIDIITSPAWSPAALAGGRNDVRILGVMVGEPRTQ